MPGADPVAAGQLQEQRPVEAARRAVIDILDTGGLPQLGGTGAALKAFLPPQRRFLFQQQGQPFGMRQAGDLRLRREFREALGHAVQAELVQQVECWMGAA